MAEDPLYIKILDKLGVNTTRLRWRLYRLEQRGQQVAERKGLPQWLEWMRYPHKICRHCGAVNDRDDRACHRCERSLPSMTGYRVARVLGLIMPDSAPVTMTAFLAAITLVYGVAVLIDGFHIMMHSQEALILLGAFTSRHHPVSAEWWRMLSFSLVHGGLIHIGFNLFALSQIGPVLESHIGRKQMLVVVTATQFSAALGTFFWYTVMRGGAPFLTVGASGWLCGLLGFGIVLFRETQNPYRQMLIQWAVYVILFGIVIGANNAAHIGGMLGGMLIARLMSGQTPNDPRTGQFWTVASGICLVLWALAVLSAASFAVTHWEAFLDLG